MKDLKFVSLCFLALALAVLVLVLAVIPLINMSFFEGEKFFDNTKSGITFIIDMCGGEIYRCFVPFDKLVCFLAVMYISCYSLKEYVFSAADAPVVMHSQI